VTHWTSNKAAAAAAAAVVVIKPRRCIAAPRVQAAIGESTRAPFSVVTRLFTSALVGRVGRFAASDNYRRDPSHARYITQVSSCAFFRHSDLDE